MCGGILKNSQGHLTTPSFPNQYPLNTLCIWNFPNTTSNRFLFFDFPKFQLATNHYLQFTSQNPKSVMARFQTKPTASLLFKSNGSDSVTFSAQPPNTTVLDSSDLVAQGFDVNFWVLGKCLGVQDWVIYCQRHFILSSMLLLKLWFCFIVLITNKDLG